MSEAAMARTALPAISIEQAHALLTASGATFEMEEVTVAGRPMPAWKNGPKSLVEIWLAAAYAPRTSIVAGDTRVSCDAFRRAAFAQALIARGVRKGDRFAILMRNEPEWIIAFHGAALAGAIATPLNAWWSAAELAFAVGQLGATVAVFDEDRFTRTRDTLGGCDALAHRFVAGYGAALPPGAVALEDVTGQPGAWAALPEAGVPPVALGPEDNATLFYTSGTSGKPKGALATHRGVTTAAFAMLMSQARAYLRRGAAPPVPSPDDPQKSYLLTIPMFHVTGCFAALNGAMAIGAELVILRKWDALLAMELIQTERVNAIGGVPAIAWQLLEHPDRARSDLSSVDALSYGGAPAAPELVRRFSQVLPQAQIGTGWGMTETCATFTHHTGEDYLKRPDSCGLVTAVGEARVVDPGGNVLPIGSIGELWVRGPGVVRGYWERPEENAATFHDGWMKTGDLVRIVAEGFCTIVDRVEDVVIRGGENIDSVEVEDALYTHPAIMDAALVPIPHQILGEEGGAVVTLRDGSHATEEELKAHAAARLAPFQDPRPRDPGERASAAQCQRQDPEKGAARAVRAVGRRFAIRPLPLRRLGRTSHDPGFPALKYRRRRGGARLHRRQPSPRPRAKGR